MAEKLDHDDLITCPICFEHFTDPKHLPCFHTFCHPCLKSYIITHLGGEGEKGQDFPCPVCRQVVSVTDKTLSSEKIADNIPGNHLIATLMDRSIHADEHQGHRRQLCDPCRRDENEVTAVKWCMHCVEALCQECTTFHKRLDPSKHKTIPIGEIESKKSTTPLDVDEPCIKHAGKFLEVYCVDHKEMCCVICLATSHRKCENISTFEEMANNSNEAETFEHFNNKLSDLDKKTEDLKIKTAENLSHLNTKYDKITQDVSSHIQQAKDKLDQFQIKFELQFKQKHKKESVKLAERKDRIEIYQDNVKRGQKLLQVVSEQGSPKQKFITREKIKQQLNDQVRQLEEDLGDVRCVDYVLNLDTAVTSVVQTVECVADVDINCTSDLSRNLTDIVKVTNQLGAEKLDSTSEIDVMKFRKVGSTDVRENFTGGTYLMDGRMVFCNWSVGKLQAFDKSGKSLFETVDLDHKPADVCCISDKDIFVSFDDQSYMKKYEVTQVKFVEKSTIPCKHDPWGLAATEDSIIVGYLDRVDILSLDGSFKETLSTKTNSTFGYVTVSPNGHVLYTDGNDVVCKALDGREITRYSHPNLKVPLGIATYKCGNVYVCGNKSQNVCVFSPDGRQMQILNEDIKNPFKIGIDPQSSGLFVTSHAYGADLYTREMRQT